MSVRRLLEDVRREQIRARDIRRRAPIGFDRGRPQAGGLRDGDGPGVHGGCRPLLEGLADVRIAAIRRVQDRRPFGRGRDGHENLRVVEAVFRTEPGLLDEAIIEADVLHGRRGIGQRQPCIDVVRHATIRDVRLQNAEGHAIDKSRPVPVEQGNRLSLGTQFERRVKACGCDFAIRPHEQVALGGNRRQGSAIRRELPLGRGRRIVRQVHARKIDGSIARIVQLDPVVVLPLRIGPKVGVRRKHFIDHDRDRVRIGNGTINGLVDARHSGVDMKRQDGHHGETATTQRPPIIENTFTCSSCLRAPKISASFPSPSESQSGFSNRLPRNNCSKIRDGRSNLCPTRQVGFARSYLSGRSLPSAGGSNCSHGRIVSTVAGPIPLT